MAPRRTSGAARLLAAAVAALAGLHAAQLLFVQATGPARHPVRVVRAAAYESGKVNVGVEVGDGSGVKAPPDPVLSCDTSCVAAIEECVEEGCSVDALMKLDQKLAEDEKKISETMSQLKDMQKTESVEVGGQLAWLDNFLSRSGTLRGQLRALKPVEDTPFVQQMIKAAAVALARAGPPTTRQSASRRTANERWRGLLRAPDGAAAPGPYRRVLFHQRPDSLIFLNRGGCDAAFRG
eukprot:CAMPEP_0204595622 /NCGR_PEP_ID=MMETSP0661-20131031/52782_1 /ASSEMBLY_ACC=CAM_ASM_000606 /TAXON_ID=109239 /ORGANISM="Alexandrium margalefi, Strain AMGDE01CS-322" /LENGTH=236 /DNA_ID=CAMNT_0051606167 /DNA_START=12 /DNA_END=720 /DNA_ORIENTATION=+